MMWSLSERGPAGCPLQSSAGGWDCPRLSSRSILSSIPFTGIRHICSSSAHRSCWKSGVSHLLRLMISLTGMKLWSITAKPPSCISLTSRLMRKLSRSRSLRTEHLPYIRRTGVASGRPGAAQPSSSRPVTSISRTGLAFRAKICPRLPITSEKPTRIPA
ncbi:hypothetical protein D3C71_1149120 [compost metagenome]